MNSPNIVVYEDYPLGVDDSGLLKQDSIKPYIRVNKGQVKNRKERVIDALKSHEWFFQNITILIEIGFKILS